MWGRGEVIHSPIEKICIVSTSIMKDQHYFRTFLGGLLYVGLFLYIGFLGGGP
jgi:hypothetical protein